MFYYLGMDNNKNFMSWVIIMIIIIIMISLNSITVTKIVKIRWKHFTDVHVSEYDNRGIYGTYIVLSHY